MKIHLHSVQGLFTVVDYDSTTLWLATKTRPTFTASVREFKSLAGGHWNAGIPNEDIQLFLKTVTPETVKKSEDLDNKILALAHALNKQEERVYQLSQQLEELTPDNNDDWLKDVRQEEAQRTPKEWNDMLSKRDDQIQDLRKKLEKIATQVYKSPVDLSNFENTDGIKFIIQIAHNDQTDCRMCFDPYQFVDNFHSSISAIYRSNKYFTANGGWLKVIGKDVILYSKSGDYGVYDDATAVKCAEKLFPGKKIHSYAGRQWDSELEALYYELPF